MPKLINLSSTFEVKEYFPKAYWHSGIKYWNFKTEDEYPFICHAHYGTCDSRLLKDIRLYVEKYGKDDVFYSKTDKSYSYCCNLSTVKHAQDKIWDKISNFWFSFYFGTEADRTMLMLKHKDLKLEITKFHPEYYWHTENNTCK